MSKPTSIWVPIDKVVPHPRNANEMTDEEMEKLDASIGQWEFAPLIVRSLELTEAFIDEREAGLWQILDGEHRWKREKERGATEIEIRVWSGITDQRAIYLLAVLNPLRGKHDKRKHASLIEALYRSEPDIKALSRILPETEEQIAKIIEEVERGDVHDVTGRARQVAQREPLTIFCGPGQAEIIRRAIREQMKEMDEPHQSVDCEEGEALSAICTEYLERTGQ